MNFSRVISERPSIFKASPADEKIEGLDLFGLAVRVGTVQGFYIIDTADLCCPSADGTVGGDIPDAAAGQVIGDLGDDHIGLINGDPVSGSQLQPLHDTEVVDTGPAYGGPLQLHWLEYGHRIDKSRPGGAPFNIGEGGLLELVRPLKGKESLGNLAVRPRDAP